MMTKKTVREFLLSSTAIITCLILAKILLHLLNPEYGYHRDELYYIAVSDNFNIYNWDMLPLTPLFLKLFTGLFGYSLKAIHFASAFCGALSILFACLITKELGGRKPAIFVTGLGVLFSGFLIFGAIFTYDSLDFLLGVCTIYLLVRILKENRPVLWVWLGLILGLALLNKLTALFLGFAIFISFWLVPQRAFYKSIRIWLAGFIALIFMTPFIIWQMSNNWYFIDFARNYAGRYSYFTSFPEFLWNQIIPNNIVTFPIWLTGLILLLFSSAWKKYRFFGICFCVLFFLFYFLGAKFYFLVPFYTILISVGAIKIEEYFFASGIANRRILIKMGVFTLIFLAFSIPILPIAIPILSVEQFVAYTQVMGVSAGVKTENHQLNQLPQHFADRFGWEEMVQEVARVYSKISPNDQQEFGILARNWGQASALYFYHKKYNLPEPVSNDGWFYFEAIRTHQFKDSYVSIGVSQQRLKNIFTKVEKAGFYSHPYCMPHENNKTIYICREPKYNLSEYWKIENAVDEKFLQLMREEGVTQAIAYYKNAKRNNPAILMFTEQQINALGYCYLSQKNLGAAIELFLFNVEIFPASSNVYDSLGEGYMMNGNYESAINNYMRSLELNPDNTNAVEMLKKIEQLKSKPE